MSEARQPKDPGLLPSDYDKIAQAQPPKKLPALRLFLGKKPLPLARLGEIMNVLRAGTHLMVGAVRYEIEDAALSQASGEWVYKVDLCYPKPSDMGAAPVCQRCKGEGWTPTFYLDHGKRCPDCSKEGQQ